MSGSSEFAVATNAVAVFAVHSGESASPMTDVSRATVEVRSNSARVRRTDAAWAMPPMSPAPGS
jgi:hypothetical protein